MPTSGPVAEQFAPVAEDNVNGKIVTEARYSYSYTSGTTAGVAVKASPGFIHSITITSALTTAVITVYDNTAASGPVVFQHTEVTGNLGVACVILDCVMTTGIELVIATANANVTITYR